MNMSNERVRIQAAAQDLRERSLAGLPGEFARLIYLASTRDYNSGQYYHEGLAEQFTPQVAVCALAVCHDASFKSLVHSSLEELVKELEIYVKSSGEQAEKIVATWEKLEPYRVAVPLDVDPLAAEFFNSNVRVALAILRVRQGVGRDNPQSA